jgi:uncharacterized protein YerC
MGSMTFEEMMAALDKRNAVWEAWGAEISRSFTEWKVKSDESDRKFNQMMQVVGSFQRNLGDIIEFILIPKIRQKINRYGHDFNVLSPNKQFINKKTGDILKEVDLMLENCEEVLAIEIKSNFKIKDVKEHLRRLRFLRKNEATTGMRGRAMYAGIACITVSESARELALGHGMYVITIHEEDDRVDVIPPKTKGRW